MTVYGAHQNQDRGPSRTGGTRTSQNRPLNAASTDPGVVGRGVDLPEYLSRWVSKQRWYANKGRVPVLRSIGDWTMPTPELGVRIRTHLALDTTSASVVLYQVPLTERSAPLPGGEHALIASAEVGAGATRFVYDAPHDPAYAHALLRFILGQRSSSDGDTFAQGEALFGSLPHSTDPTVASSRVLRGEQSNTSIIFDLVDDDTEPARPLICKVFRVLHHGQNPDVSVQFALARAGSRFVPEPVGCVVGEWDDPGQPDGRATGHLAFAQEYMSGAEDAWRVALLAIEAGEDFTGQARKLGEATADVHARLAQVMPTREATPEVIASVLRGMRERFYSAAREVPALAAHGSAVEAIFARARTATWPRLQRLHGDYHLGQVLDVPGRGWVLLDFEGEPLRPMRERDEPDVTMRDVAGMLRSFSYLAGTFVLAHPGQDASAATGWVVACRRAFLEGYADRSGLDTPDRSVLLDAYELDKAIYEAVYETRNRPSWLPIPLEAVREITARVRLNHEHT